MSEIVIHRVELHRNHWRQFTLGRRRTRGDLYPVNVLADSTGYVVCAL